MATVASKNAAILRWISASPFVCDLYFNFLPARVGATGVETISGERTIKRYISGGALKAYEFGVIQYKGLNQDVPNSEENAETLAEIEDFMTWAENQNRLRNYPEFEGCAIQKLEVLNNLPVVSGQDGEKAKYLFTVRVTYLEG